MTESYFEKLSKNHRSVFIATIIVSLFMVSTLSNFSDTYREKRKKSIKRIKDETATIDFLIKYIHTINNKKKDKPHNKKELDVYDYFLKLRKEYQDKHHVNLIVNFDFIFNNKEMLFREKVKINKKYINRQRTKNKNTEIFQSPPIQETVIKDYSENILNREYNKLSITEIDKLRSELLTNITKSREYLKTFNSHEFKVYFNPIKLYKIPLTNTKTLLKKYKFKKLSIAINTIRRFFSLYQNADFTKCSQLSKNHFVLSNNYLKDVKEFMIILKRNIVQDLKIALKNIPKDHIKELFHIYKSNKLRRNLHNKKVDPKLTNAINKYISYYNRIGFSYNHIYDKKLKGQIELLYNKKKLIWTMPQKNSSLESFSPLFLVHGKMKTRLISRYDFQISNYQLTKIIFRLNKINQNKNTSETKRLFIDLYKHELSGLYHRSYNEYSINNFSSSPNHTYFAIIKIKKFINDFNNLTKFSNAKKKYGSIPYPDLGQKNDNRKYFNVPIALYVVKDFNYYHFLYLREYLIEVESNLPVNKKPEPTKDKDQLQKAKKKETTVKIPYLPFYFSKLALRVISPYFILVLLLMLLYIHILIEQKLFNKFHIWDQEENKKTILNMKSQTWILGNLYFQQKDSKLIPFFIYSIGYGLIIYAFATNFYNEYFYFTTSLLWDFSIYQFINFVSLGVIPSVSILLITWKTGKSIIAIRNELKKSPHYLS